MDDFARTTATAASPPPSATVTSNDTQAAILAAMEAIGATMAQLERRQQSVEAQMRRGNEEPSTSNGQGGQGGNKQLPVDLHLDDNTRARIWAGEAVDFRLLLPQQPKDKDGKEEKRPILEWEWVRAFNVFCAVYLDKKDVHRALAAHMGNVMELMQKKGDWRGYDTRFRLAIQGGFMGWGDFNPGLFTEARLEVPRNGDKGVKGGAPYGKGTPIPRSFCYPFHNQGVCARRECRFKHFCFKCGDKHSILACTQTESFRSSDISRDNTRKEGQSREGNRKR
jgi:hypothetical protein